MRSRTFLLMVTMAAAATALAAQDRSTTTQSKQQTTVQNPDGSTSTTTVTGEVTRFEPGHTIVIRRPDNTEATYTLDSSVEVPTDVQVGRQVTLVTQSQDGTIHIRKITTVTRTGPGSSDMSREKSSSMSDQPGSSSMAPMAPSQSETRQSTTETRSSSSTVPPSQSETQQSTTETRSTASIAPSSPQAAPDTSGQTQTTESTSSKVTTVTGTVRTYQPGQSITILGPDRKVTTYTITEGIQVPQDVAVGKRVTIETTMVSGKPVVKSVTTKTVTTHTKTVSPK